MMVQGRFDEVLDLLGSSEDYWKERSEIYLAKNDLNSLETLLSKIVTTTEGPEAFLLYYRAQLALRTGKIPETEELLHQSIHLAIKAQETLLVFKAKLVLGVVHFSRAEFNEIQAIIGEVKNALANQSSPSHKYLLSKAHVLAGNTFWRQGRNKKALKQHYKAMSLAKELGNHQFLATILNNIAVVYENQGALVEALASHEEALALREKLGDEEGVAQSQNNIGLIYHTNGRLGEALTFFRHSLNYFEKQNDLNSLSGLYLNIGAIYHDQGMYKPALDVFTKALSLGETLTDPYVTGVALENLGTLYSDLGKNDQAVIYYMKALDAFKKVGNPQSLANLVASIAVSLFQAGTLSSGNELLREFPPPPHDTQTISGYRFIIEALLLQQEGDLVTAEQMWEQSIQTPGLSYGFQTYAQLALVEVALRRWKKDQTLGVMTSITKRLESLESLCLNQKLTAVLCKTYLLWANFHASLFQLDQSEELLEKCVSIAEQNGLPLHLKLAQQELTKLQTQEQVFGRSGRREPETMAEDFASYLRDIDRLIGEQNE